MTALLIVLIVVVAVGLPAAYKLGLATGQLRTELRQMAANAVDMERVVQENALTWERWVDENASGYYDDEEQPEREPARRRDHLRLVRRDEADAGGVVSAREALARASHPSSRPRTDV